MEILDIAIIGGGPAGIAAGIQLKRCGYSPVVFEKDRIGGLIRSANLVENYPGFHSGITGKTLAERLIRHLNQWKIKIYRETAEKVNFQNDLFKIKTNHNEYSANILLIASGTKPKNLKLLNLTEEAKSKVFYDLNPLLKVKNKHIGIIGGGDAAFDYGLNLAKNNKVSILCRSTTPHCLWLLFQKQSRDENINFFNEVTIDNIVTENNNLVIKGLRKVQPFEFKCDYLLAAIGREENLEFVEDSLDTQKYNLVSKKRLYFIGDVKNSKFRQISLAVADGVKAAMDINDNFRSVNEDSGKIGK
jgi:thioredoxin reductase (NADPH)